MKKSTRIDKRAIRIIIGIICALLLVASWYIAVNSKSTAEKQLLLMGQASDYIDDEVYILAAPLLEEAAGYEAKHTIIAEEILKGVYLKLLDTRGFSRKYADLLSKQLARADVEPAAYIEAASYHLNINARQDALAILRDGIAKTGDDSITAMYENERYVYDINRNYYDTVTLIYEGKIQVEMDGKWGIANADGSPFIKCQYDKISTFSDSRAVCLKNNEVYAVNKDNNRLALASDTVHDFGNLSENRISLYTDNGWRRATGDFEIGSAVFDDIGMYSDGCAAAKVNGRWGIINTAGEWLIPAQYDDVIRDEIGRCWAQNAVFVRSGDSISLYSNKGFIDAVYEDARPFSAEGYAAVCRNGKWGFIDTAGNVMIDFVYDDALSFGGHLAAVRLGDMWGYVSVYGELVIKPAFLDAKSFSNGNAPVLTERGWQFITLIEYKKKATL